MSSEAGLFAFGGFDIFTSHCYETVQRLRHINGGVMYLADDGGGFLSKSLAKLLVGHIKEAIDTEGSSIGATYRDTSQVYKDLVGKIQPGRDFFHSTGKLYENITALNRRYEGGRGWVAGISQRAPAVPHFGWAGLSRTGRTVKIHDYAYSITFGSDQAPARPVIPEAIAHFMSQIVPDLTSIFWDKQTREMKRYFDEPMRDVPEHQSITNQVLNGVTPQDFEKGTSVAGEVGGIDSSGKQNFSKADRDMYKAARATMSAKAARELVKAVQEVSG